ncbi:hypothetical protein ACS0PU_000262 [Formica fusca]
MTMAVPHYYDPLSTVTSNTRVCWCHPTLAHAEMCRVDLITKQLRNCRSSFRDHLVTRVSSRAGAYRYAHARTLNGVNGGLASAFCTTTTRTFISLFVFLVNTFRFRIVEA